MIGLADPVGPSVDVNDLANGLGDVLGALAQTVIAVGVIGAAMWRLGKPHFTRLVRQAATTAKATEQTATVVSDLPSTLQRLDERQGRVEGVLATLSALPERMTVIEGRQERESARVDVLQEALLGHITNRDRER